LSHGKGNDILVHRAKQIGSHCVVVYIIAVLSFRQPLSGHVDGPPRRPILLVARRMVCEDCIVYCLFSVRVCLCVGHAGNEIDELWQ